jgi:mannitol-1-phosphate/altronate dehydrogenase
MSIASQTEPIKPKILIFGAGKLTLGLLAALHSSDEAEIHLCGRRTGKSAPIVEAIEGMGGYQLRIRAEDPQAIRIDAVHYTDEDSGIDEIGALLHSNVTVAILTSVKDNQETIVDLLLKALARRPGEIEFQDLLVIPCENRVHPCFKDLTNTSGLCRQIILCQTMVDRICSTPPIISAEGVVSIETEPFHEWWVQPPSGISGGTFGLGVSAILEDLLGALITGDLEPIRDRKTLLMNGVHACIAVLAREAQIDGIQDYATNYLEGRFNLEGLSMEFAALLAYRHPDESYEEIMDWMVLYQDRIVDDPNETASRILERLSADRIDEFFEDWRHKVASPLRQMGDLGGNSVFLAKAFAALGAELRRLFGSES